MRLSAAVVIPILLAIGGQAARARSPEDTVYVVECRMITTSPDGEVETQLGPCVTISEGRTAVINDVTQTPLVTGVVMKKGQECPRVTVFDEGTKIELAVFRESDGWATLDAKIETSKLSDVKTKTLQRGGQRHCPRLETRSIRVIESAALGDEFSVVLGGTPKDSTGRTIEFVVYTPDMPRHWYEDSATPRRASWTARLMLIFLRALAAVNDRG
jgi:hypothetical protein